MKSKQSGANETSLAAPKKKLWIVGGVVLSILLLMIVLIVVENTGKNDLTVKNETSRNLEYVKLHFASMDTDFTSDEFFNQAMKPGETVNSKTPHLNLYQTQARLFVTFKFEGEEEETIDNGWFDYDFTGKTYVTFKEESEHVITLDVSIKEGLFSNQGYNTCREHWEYEY